MAFVQEKGRTAFYVDDADLAAASLDPQYFLLRTIKRVGIENFRAGISAAKVGDAKFGAQQIGAVAQQIWRIQTAGNALVPAVFQKTEFFFRFHQELLAARFAANGIRQKYIAPLWISARVPDAY